MILEDIRQSEWYQNLQSDPRLLAKLGDQILELAGHLNAAHYRFLMLIAEWDSRKGWSDGASQSCAHWLNWKCGIDLGAAREKVRTAHALAELPKIAAAMQRGELSYAKVRALTRVACPKTENTFLQYALHGTAAHVERIVRDYRRCKEAVKGGERHQIVVHVDAETLRESTAGRCQFEHGPSISAETARRLACDCSIVPIIESEDGELLNVGRKTRSIPLAIQRALNARDHGCCRFPGCPNTRYLDGHHIQHWAHGGETKLSNLVSLCRFHHRQVHEGNVVVLVLDDGAVRFVTPKGESFDSTLPEHTQPLGDWRRLVATHDQQELHIDRHTAATRWDGESYDHSFAVAALLRHWRGRPVTASDLMRGRVGGRESRRL